MKRNTVSRPYIRVARQLFSSLNSPRALTCEILVRHEEWDQLVSMTVDPTHYLDCPAGAAKFLRDTQATSFLRKSGDLPTTFSRRDAALDSFELCEKQCAETNYLLDFLRFDPGRCPLFERATQILCSARKIVRSILGPLPPSLDGRFGPGTSFELRGTAYNTLADKLWVTPAVTREAFAVWRHTTDGLHFARRRLELGLPDHQIVRGNRFTTVPKDAKTDRGICIEPLGNLYCQLGVGSYLKERLKRVGLFVNRNDTPVSPLLALRHVDRPNGQTIHRRLAAMASRTGDMATIDLSNASDTVAYSLVRELLPKPWFELLSALRSPFTLLPNGKWVKLEKFSSMGNGFTFELETLLFASLIAATCDGLEIGRNLFVYGDDILLPSTNAADALACLSFFGFTPNGKKTYTAGPFRESCGGDFFDGWDVRPYFSKGEPTSPIEWIALHNRMKEIFPSFTHLHRCVIEHIPKHLRFFGPKGRGDAWLHSDDPSRWHVIYENGVLYVKGVRGNPVKIPLDRWGHEFVVSLALLGVGSDGITPRGEIASWSACRLSIS